MSVTSGEHDECMICLESLLDGEPDEDETYIESSLPEVGAVWPCGHCFHLKCWNQWKKDRCPSCNQPAALFSKIFISAPPRCRQQQQQGRSSLPLTSDEREELERYRAMLSCEEAAAAATAATEQGSERMLLRDMERQSGKSNNNAKMRQSMTMMMMVQSRDLRRAERALLDCQEEHEETKDVLRVAQTELESAHKEIADLKPRMEQLQKQVTELQRERQIEQETSGTTPQSERDRKRIALLQEKLERAKEKLALKNKQLSRRNKELAAKKKQLSTTAAKGKEEQRASRKTSLELERTKKELELLKELDSFTMEGSSTSMGLSMIWD